jgi:hypothetical protein
VRAGLYRALRYRRRAGNRAYPGHFCDAQGPDGAVHYAALDLFSDQVAAVLFMWLGVDLAGDFSLEASLYRIIIRFAPIMLFYSAVAYLLLGRLRWFRKNIDEGALPQPPPPPEFR